MNEFRLTEKEQAARKRVCLPLDNLETLSDLTARVEKLSPVVGLFKIGFESFTRFGPDAIKAVQSYGSQVFLDLKYHDIPNTVQGAARAATSHGVYMFNVHASGGLKMMEVAVKGVDEAVEKYGIERPKVIGVTVLTSFDEANYLQTFQPLNPRLREIDFSQYTNMKKDDEELREQFRAILRDHGLEGVIGKQVLHLAQLAHTARLDGIVCSAADLAAVKPYIPEGFMYVTPGVEGPITKAGADQARVFSPGNALLAGSTILVVGRAITNAEDQVLAGYQILQDMAKRM